MDCSVRVWQHWRYYFLLDLAVAPLRCPEALKELSPALESAKMLDPGLSEALRLASLAFCIAHSAMAVYGGFLAAQSGESALAWFLKILFTGAGGLNEIKGVAARPAEQS